MAMKVNRGESSSSVQAPPVRGIWDNRVIAVLECAALMPLLGAALFERGGSWLVPLFASLLTTLFWQRVFAEVRHRPMPVDGAATALVFALVLPPSMPLWQIALSLSFGMVVGQEIFGGRGRNFLNPAVVALAFQIFSFPDTALAVFTRESGIAILPGMLLLLLTGVVSWRVIVAAVATFSILSASLGSMELPTGLAGGGFLFGLIFFAGDPVAAASTNPGRWIHGVVFGGSCVALAGAGIPPTIEAVVFAALIASVFAPLTDQGVVWLNVHRRNRRHG